MHYRGTLYRALNPYWAYRPLSGEGAANLGGRFNRLGRPALYLSCAIETTILETNQAGTLMPTTLVAFDVDLDPLFDATEPDALDRFQVTPADLALKDWAMQMELEGIAPTQAFAEDLIAAGFCGMRVPSYAPGAPADACNVVLWTWGAEPPAQVLLIDGENRLRHPPAPP